MTVTIAPAPKDYFGEFTKVIQSISKDITAAKDKKREIEFRDRMTATNLVMSAIQQGMKGDEITDLVKSAVPDASPALMYYVNESAHSDYALRNANNKEELDNILKEKYQKEIDHFASMDQNAAKQLELLKAQSQLQTRQVELLEGKDKRDVQQQQFSNDMAARQFGLSTYQARMGTLINMLSINARNNPNGGGGKLANAAYFDTLEKSLHGYAQDLTDLEKVKGSFTSQGYENYKNTLANRFADSMQYAGIGMTNAPKKSWWLSAAKQAGYTTGNTFLGLSRAVLKGLDYLPTSGITTPGSVSFNFDKSYMETHLNNFLRDLQEEAASRAKKAGEESGGLNVNVPATDLARKVRNTQINAQTTGQDQRTKYIMQQMDKLNSWYNQIDSFGGNLASPEGMKLLSSADTLDGLLQNIPRENLAAPTGPQGIGNNPFVPPKPTQSKPANPTTGGLPGFVSSH